MSELMVCRDIHVESVTEGHPDKIADQISTVLDAVLEQDPYDGGLRETLVTTGICMVAL